MTNTMQNPIAPTHGARTDRTPYSLDKAAETQRLDCNVGREYLPMNVFVDPKTMRQHFQVLLIRA